MSVKDYLQSPWFWIGVSLAIIILINLVYKPEEDPPKTEAALPSANQGEIPPEPSKSDQVTELCIQPRDSPRPTRRMGSSFRVDLSRRIPVTTTRTSRSKGEEICCRVMEELTGLPFTTVRPSFLKNPETGRNLEIDCYNDHLKLGVEYNGIQHYVYPNFTGQTYDQFISQVRRDEFKVRACDEHGVYLITVPYTVPHDQIRDYIIDRLSPLLTDSGDISESS